MQQWEQLTERLGFWIHLDEAYVTFHQSYVESVWWALKTLFDRGLLYQGHKIVWWWAQGGTALSPAARSAKAIAKWPTPASSSASRWWTSPNQNHNRAPVV
jgi:isoleucyl-tRNA synthetase